MIRRGVILATGIAAAVACIGGVARSEPALTLSKAEAKKLIVQHRRRLFSDADSVRDARVSNPYVCPTKDGVCVCVEANARNAYGGFTGLQLIGFRVRGRDIEALGEMGVYARKGTCGQTLTPFPELNGRRR